MKGKYGRTISCVALFGFLTLCMPLNKTSFAAEVSLRVLNPRGEITLPPILAPAARVADLSGKKIAIYWNGKAGGDNLWNNVEALLRKKIQNPNILRYEGAFDLGDALAEKIAREADVFMYGVGD
jgi:hypothetical protein